MKRYYTVILSLFTLSLFVSCAILPSDRYNTQKGAVIGAGAGALIGQAIGGNTEATLIGLAAGTILGTLVGNAVDQEYRAAEDAARHGKPVIYYDKSGHAVEAVPEDADAPHCRKVRKRIWENGVLVKETVEEVCEPPPRVVRRYYYVPVRPAYSYGWWVWPFYPTFSFHFGKSYNHGYHRHYPHHSGHHGWHHH